MKKDVSFSKKIISLLLVIAIIIVASLTILLFFTTSSVSKSHSSNSKKSSDNDSNIEDSSGLNESQAINLDNFSVGYSKDINTIDSKDTDDNDTVESDVTSDDVSSDVSKDESIDESDVNGDYIIADSDARYLTDEDLEGLSEEDLLHARNEIYARHGRIFDSEELQEYFESKDWYEPIYTADEFNEDDLNEYEKENVKFIKNYEEENGYD